MWDEVSLTSSERREQRLLYVQDPSYECVRFLCLCFELKRRRIIAYPERKSYWLQTRMLELRGGNWDYEERVVTDSESDKIIHDFLGVRCPDWFDNTVRLSTLSQHYHSSICLTIFNIEFYSGALLAIQTRDRQISQTHRQVSARYSIRDTWVG